MLKMALNTIQSIIYVVDKFQNSKYFEKAKPFQKFSEKKIHVCERELENRWCLKLDLVYRNYCIVLSF